MFRLAAIRRWSLNEDNPSAGPELLKRRFQLQCFYDLKFASFGKSFNSCDEGINKYSFLSPKTLRGCFASEKKEPVSQGRLTRI
jgi:hypothetical protein